MVFFKRVFYGFDGPVCERSQVSGVMYLRTSTKRSRADKNKKNDADETVLNVPRLGTDES